MKVVGELPGRDIIRSSRSEYKRQLRQYRQMFRLAQITEIDESKVSTVESTIDIREREEKTMAMLDSESVRPRRGRKASRRRELKIA